MPDSPAALLSIIALLAGVGWNIALLAAHRRPLRGALGRHSARPLPLGAPVRARPAARPATARPALALAA